MNVGKARVVLLGIAQDGGVPQCGCFCDRCLAVHTGEAPELYPVSLGVTDKNGAFHLIEASRTLSSQLFVWAKALGTFCRKEGVVNSISSVCLTHLHLGHIDGLGLFGREVMGCDKGSVRLHASKPVLDELKNRAVMDPFAPVAVENGKSIKLGPGVEVEFHRVPHREEEKCGQTHGIVIRGEERSIFFLPDHDFYDKTLEWQKMKTLRQWFKHLSVDVVLIDGTFYTKDEVAGRRKDASGIPHPSLKESLELLGKKQSDDPEIIFIHLNHTNTVINDPAKRSEVETLGWQIGEQGQVFEI